MIRRDLNSLVALNKVDETSDLDIMVLLPGDFTCDFLLLLLEEDDPTGASCDQCLVIKEVHLTEISVIHLLISVIIDLDFILFWSLECDGEALTTSIECVDFIILVIIERLIREVFLGGV